MHHIVQFFTSRKLTLFMIFSLAFVVFISFGPGINGEFVWDDEEQVIANVAVHDIRNIPTLFAGSTFNSGGSRTLGGMYYKPLMSVVFTLLYAVVGPQPFLFHFIQVSIHCINAMLIFGVLRKLLTSNAQLEHANHTSILQWIAFGGAFLFAVHPLNVETALYISALQDVLYFFFGISGFALLIQYTSLNKVYVSPIKHAWYMIAIMLLLFCSMLSKETGVLFVVLSGLFVFMFFKGKPYQKVTLLSLLTAPFLSYILLRFGYAHVGLLKTDISPISAASFDHRLLTLPKVLLFYISHAAYPQDLLIAQHWIVKTATINDFYIPLAIVLVVLMISCALLVHIRSRLLLFFFGWVTLGLGLHAHIFPLDMTVADRWAYFPLAGMIGIVCCVVFYVYSHFDFSQKRQIYVVIFCVPIFIFSLRSFVRAQNWQSSLALYGNDIEKNPGAYDLQNNYGVILFRANLYDEALSHFEQSIQLEPRWWTNWNNAGAIYERKGDLAKAQLHYERAIMHSTYYLAYENYVGILMKQEKRDEARKFLETALHVFPQNIRLLQMQKLLEAQ